MTLRSFFFAVLKIIATGIGLILLLIFIVYIKFVSLYSGDSRIYLNSPETISTLHKENKKLDLTQIYTEDWDYLMVVVPYQSYLDDRFDLFWVRFFLFDIFLDGTCQYDNACDLVFFKGRKPVHIVTVGRHIVDFNPPYELKVYAREEAKFLIKINELNEFIAVPEIQKENSQRPSSF